MKKQSEKERLTQKATEIINNYSENDDLFVIIEKLNGNKIDSVFNGKVSNNSIFNLVKTAIDKDDDFKVEIRTLILDDFINDFKTHYLPFIKSLISNISEIGKDFEVSSSEETENESDQNQKKEIDSDIQKIVDLINEKFPNSNGSLKLPKSFSEIFEPVYQPNFFMKVYTDSEIFDFTLEALEYLNIKYELIENDWVAYL